MTTFMGPAGGAPVPSITMTLRMVSVGKGSLAFSVTAIGRRDETILLSVHQRMTDQHQREGAAAA